MKTIDKDFINHKTDGSFKDTKKANELLRGKLADIHSYDGLVQIKMERAQKEEARRPLFFFIGLTLSLLFVIIVFNWKTYDASSLVDLGEVENDFDELMEVPISQQPPPPPPKQVEALNIQAVDNAEIIEEIEFNLDVEISEDMAIQDVVFNQAIPDFGELGVGELGVEEEVAEEILEIVEVQPAFPGGISKFYQYVAESIKYPSAAERLGVSGRVFIQFVIEKDGTPSQIAVIKGIGSGCDEEAVRVLENSPKWNPGKQRGHPVRVRMTVPILFSLVQE